MCFRNLRIHLCHVMLLQLLSLGWKHMELEMVANWTNCLNKKYIIFKPMIDYPTSSLRLSSLRVGGIPGCFAFRSSIRLWVAWSLCIWDKKKKTVKKQQQIARMDGWMEVELEWFTWRESVFSLALCSSDDRNTSLYISAASANSPGKDRKPFSNVNSSWGRYRYINIVDVQKWGSQYL